jgi:diguanylate cyclase (GGDEF)-like protein
LRDNPAMSMALGFLAVGQHVPEFGSSLALHAVEQALTLDAAGAALAQRSYDAVLIRCADGDDAHDLEHWPPLAQAVQTAAVLVVMRHDELELAQRLVQRGVQDVLVDAGHDAAAGDAALGRALSLALVRKRLELMQRKGGSIDLATGLPTAQQWMDHLTHLCALREREPAPMAVLVLRVEGLASVEDRLGAQAAQILRRKVAVRLRSALRASDLVGSLGNDAYAVLLTWLLAPTDSMLVRDKLVKAMRRPFSVGGDNLVVAVSTGCTIYPDQARDAESLLRIAHAEAASHPGVGRAGFANPVEAAAQGQLGAGLGKFGAANDEVAG